jgi:hypothetical protein
LKQDVFPLAPTVGVAPAPKCLISQALVLKCPLQLQNCPSAAVFFN